MISGFFGKYRWLSNFWEHPVIYQGVTAPTAEHHYQAAKAANPSDAAAVLAAESPGAAKRLGTKIALRSDWDRVRYSVMESIVTAKFADPNLAQLLLATGTAELVESNNWHDTAWGICTCDIHGGAGANGLGHILVSTRAQLRERKETNK